MLAEVRVLLERSAARRLTLEGLLDALPADYWDRAAAGEAWSIRQHVGHLAGADEMMSELVEDVLSGAASAWVGRTEDPAMLASMRQRSVSVAESRQPPELRELA